MIKFNCLFSDAVFKINGRQVAPGDQKLGWTS